MTQHTNSPWRVEDGEGGEHYEIRFRGVGSVAAVWGVTDESAANARLIASAPELLESLRECERALRWAAQRSAGRVRADVVGGWLHQAEQASAAIAKAEGRS